MTEQNEDYTSFIGQPDRAGKGLAASAYEPRLPQFPGGSVAAYAQCVGTWDTVAYSSAYEILGNSSYSPRAFAGELLRRGGKCDGDHRPHAQRPGRGGQHPAWAVHSVEVLESGTVILESKDGPYEPQRPEDILIL